MLTLVILVKNLFYNTPARLKHLKSLYTELANITEYINKLALSHTNIRFTLINNDNLILKTDGSSLLKTIGNIYGIDTVKNMIAINGENTDYEIDGYISKPSIHKSNRNHMITIVNGRVVRNAELNKAINDAYHSYKPDNRYPVVIINIEVDPTLVDVNIHPTKMDIKFSKMEELIELTTTVIKEKLNEQTLINKVDLFENKSIFSPISKVEIKEEAEEKKVYKNIELDLSRVSEDIEEYNKKLDETISSLETKEEKIKLPEMEPIGMVHGTYIICQNNEGMYLIDQHAAKERVNYEYILEKLSNPVNKKIELLIPKTFEFSNNEFMIIKEHMDMLTKMGFTIEIFGLNSIVIKEHPVWLLKNAEDLQMKKIIESIISNEKKFNLEKFYDHLAHDLACKASIKANTMVSIDEMESLLNDLKKCENPFHCPHGRPVFIFYSRYELEKLFKRSGF